MLATLLATMSPTDKDVILRRMYLNKRYKSSFTGADAFHKSLPDHLRKAVKKPEALKILQSVKAYAQNRPAPRRFKRRKVIVHGIDAQWVIDLACLPRLAKYNNNYKYIFFCIDAFSKFLWCVPQKTKTAEETLKSLKSIIKKSGRKPQRLQSDRGTEYASVFKRYCDSQGIPIFHVESELKACIVERVIGTILSRVWRFLQHKNSFTWYKVLPDMVRNYNASMHSSIKFCPKDVSAANADQVWNNLYGKHELKAIDKPAFNVGDRVLISIFKNKMVEKGYDKKFHDEVFTVDRISDTNPRMYFLTDSSGKKVGGGWYRRELSRIFV